MQCFSRFGLAGASIVVLLGCGGTSKETHPAAVDAAAPQTLDAGPLDAQATGADATADDAAQAEDAAVTRNAACTPTSQQLGTAVNTAHGRLDGTLVYVVPVVGDADDAGYYDDGTDGGVVDGGGFHHGGDAGINGAYYRCNGDNSHVHLQVEVSGDVYDIAVDIGATGDQVGMYQEAIALPGGAWAEGWHADDLSYKSLTLSSTQFPLAAPETNAASVESLLEGTSQISIFCTGYTQGNGCHDVHYENGTSTDGAIVLNPLAATPTVLFFRFVSQSF